MSVTHPGSMTADKKIKVLFIAGPTRSGSTIISNALGQLKGFFHAGEVIEAWDRGRVWKCSCGQSPMECAVWSPIFKRVDEVFNEQDRSVIIRMRDKLSRSHKVILNHCLRPNIAYMEIQDEIYGNGLAKLYATIHHQTGARVIVDSSKNIGYADTLSKVKNIDLHVVHLIRDSRATAYSWSKKKKELWKSSLWRSSVEWNSRNLASEILRVKRPDKYLNVRYEDFIMNPQKTVRTILKHLNIKLAYLPFASSHKIVIESSHGLCGNPGRYNRGTETLRIDERWKKMKRSHMLLTTVLTWPILMRNNYRLIQ